jgi:hypothetical protein
MARNPVDLRTPGGRGVWVDRSPARRLSSPHEGAGDPPVGAARHGDLLAGHEDTPSSATLPPHATIDLSMPQVWRCLPEGTKHAFGSRFSQIVVRVLRDLRTAEGTI